MEYNTKKPLVISFYAEAKKDSFHYTKEAERFNSELSTLWMQNSSEWDYKVDKIHGFRNYYRNARFKPMYIWYQMVKYNRPILWLDADTHVSDKIPFEDFKHFDFAGVKHQKPSIKLSIYAHCLWFNNTEIGKAILKNWVSRCDRPLTHNHKNVAMIGDHSELCHHVLPKYYSEKNNIPLIDGSFCDFKITPKSEKNNYIDE